MSEDKRLKEAKEFGFTIRQFHKTKADAELLAACYRTWDDPESWPGGFGHGDPPTAENILQNLATQTPLAHFVVEAESKIVGKCDVLEHFSEEDTVYIGLLGVSPEFQGKKIGKNLLLTAINKAVELEKDIITLHTWGGNLKAVPLYKKTGFFWAPETSVYMENYLPGILRNKLFDEFFKHFNWYDVYDRDLTIKEDREKINEMLVYNYRFIGDESNKLKVIIDQKAKKMCGFELTTTKGTIAASCFVDNYIGYAGYGRVAVTWKLTNNTSKEITFSIIIDSHEDIELEEKPLVTHCLEAESTKEIKAYAKLKPTVETVSRPKESHERTKYQLSSKLLIDNKETKLSVGIVPVDPLEISIQPTYQSVLSGEETELEIRLFNRTDTKMKGSLVIQTQSLVTIHNKKINLSLEEKERKDIQLPIRIADNYGNHQLPIEMTFYIEEKNNLIKLPREKIIVAVLNNPVNEKPRCTGYLIKDRFAILENRNIRIQIMLQPPYKINYIESKLDGKKYWIHSAIPDLGMPFAGTGNELARADQKISLENQSNRTELSLEVSSQKQEGIIIKRLFCLLPNAETLQIQTNIINSSTKQRKNIGLRLISQTWGDGITGEGKAYLPLTNGLLEVKDLDNFYRNTHFPQKSEEWSEGWFGIEFEGKKLFGAIWQEEQLQRIEFKSFYAPTFEYQFETIEPGETKTIEYLIVLGYGPWQKIKQLYQEIARKKSVQKLSVDKKDHEIINELTLSTHSQIFGEPDIFGIQQINSRDELKISIKNNLMRNLSGKITITLPRGITFEDNTNYFEQEIEKLNEKTAFEKIFKLSVAETHFGRIFLADIKIVLTGNSIDLPFYLQPLNKDAKVTVIADTTEKGKEYYTVSNEKITFQASKDHSATITSLILPSLNKKNNLQTSWPKVKPFLWEEKWFGGIYPIIRNPYEWSNISYQENFSSSPIEIGLAKGVRFKASLQQYVEHQGLEIEIDHVLSPNANSLKTTLRIINTTSAHQMIEAGIGGNIAVSNEIDNDIYYLLNNKLHKRFYYSDFWQKKNKDKWVVFVNKQSKLALAIIGPNHKEFPLVIIDYGKLANGFEASRRITIPPKSTIEYDLLFILYPLHHELIELMLKKSFE